MQVSEVPLPGDDTEGKAQKAGGRINTSLKTRTRAGTSYLSRHGIFPRIAVTVGCGKRKER